MRVATSSSLSCAESDVGLHVGASGRVAGGAQAARNLSASSRACSRSASSAIHSAGSLSNNDLALTGLGCLAEGIGIPRSGERSSCLRVWKPGEPKPLADTVAEVGRIESAVASPTVASKVMDFGFPDASLASDDPLLRAGAGCVWSKTLPGSLFSLTPGACSGRFSCAGFLAAGCLGLSGPRGSTSLAFVTAFSTSGVPSPHSLIAIFSKSRRLPRLACMLSRIRLNFLSNFALSCFILCLSAASSSSLLPVNSRNGYLASKAGVPGICVL
mmetsp:Transcript_23298/g.58878  ORF Transcript_23298/g.58878 Transcript_23298/m.58878 type:complete len:272 (-) Transcript_23298:1988-2803(-)